jgi:hypothetical protein
MSNGFSLTSLGQAIDGTVSRLVRDLTAAPPAPGDVLTQAIENYRAVREGTIAIIQDLSQAQADFFPAAGIWSVGQNVEHLLLTEKLYRTKMQNLIDLARKGGKQNIELTFGDINTSIAFIPRDVMPMLTVPLNVFNLFVPRVVREAMFRFPLIPALNPSVSEPTHSQPIAQLRSRAASSLKATEEIFQHKMPPNLMNMTLSHPILGTNNVVQIFGIITAHEERHHGQIRAVLANSRFPPHELKSVSQWAGQELPAEDSEPDNTGQTPGR